MSAKTIVRGVVAMALVPCLWFGGASARYVMATRAADRTVVRTMQLDFPRPTASQRFLIVSPHPDDETLACGGLIQQAVRAGASVRVVFLTSGDGYRMAIEREYRNLALRPDDYVRFGALRRREARNAASALGLSPRRLRFLGMPDGALTDLWRTNWAETARLRSEALATDRAPYAWVVQPGAPFCGAVLLGNIEDQMDRFRPTDLLVPHPADDHGDHAASAAFVQLALARLRRGSSPWARACKLHYYLVHRGDWPQPQGKRLNEAMAPPAEMTGLDTEWRGLSLSPEEVRVKAEAIGAYRSQTSVMRRFLMSFART
ncbi:MAG: PIG-L family deacetylase, partial [Armatimonadetes bacterium]|nr:PIG-L family deacetylase [Armatimonadota bacterium]